MANIRVNRANIMRKPLLALAVALPPAPSGCGYNTLPTTGEQLMVSWSEVVNQYQRSADLVPILVSMDKELFPPYWSRSLTPAAPDHVQRRQLVQG